MPDQLRDQLQTALGADYTLARELGGGGMTRIFVAREEALGRDVVIKVLAPELAEGLSAERFAREIRLAAGLQEPHIVPVLAAGVTAQGLPYYTMPYVRGESLRTRIAQGPMMLAEVVSVMRDVATALEYAHGHGLVHRDIKPENVLLSGRTAVVTDFGIAKALAASKTQAPDGRAVPGAGTLTQVGTSLGTPAYMAPEQAAGDPVDRRADLYAWGVMAYELLANRHPFSGKSSAQQLIAAHIAETPAALQLPVPPALAALVASCLAKAPADRPESAGAVLAALDVIDLGTRGGAAPGTPPAASLGRRRLVAIGGAALAVAVAVGAVAVGRGKVNIAAAVAGPPSLAVLPFEHQGDTADIYLTDGITDEIRGKLSGVSELVVIARASSNAYRATTDSPREIAEALGVRYLLTGTVRVTGVGAARRVIVRPELVELTGTGQPQSRWGQPFDVEGTDVLRLQGDIAGQLVAAMQVAVSGADRAKLVAVPTGDPAAYDAYLRAQAAINWGADATNEGLRRAITLYEAALRRDSTLVEAWAGLSFARAMLYANSGRDETPAMAAAARAAAERTLALDPNGARGLTAHGYYRWLVAHDPAGARADLDAAVLADPDDVQARTALAFLLVESLGRPGESLPYLERGLVLDPRNAQMRLVQVEALMMLGRFAEARVAADRAVALEPGRDVPASTRLYIELNAGDTAGLRATMARLASDLPPAVLLSVAMWTGHAMDAPTAARALATDVDAYGGDRGAWALALAGTHFQRGDTARARLWGDTAIQYLAPAAARADASFRLLAELAWAQVFAGRRVTASATAIRGVARLRATMGADRGDVASRTRWDFAAIAALAGARDSALAWLREGRGQPSVLTPAAIRLDPSFASLRGDPRFEALLAVPPR